MTSQWRTFLAMLLLTVAAAGFAGWAGVQYGLHRPAQATDLDAVVHHDLDLTAEQDGRIRALETGFSHDRADLQAEMNAANRDLARAITQEHAYGPNARRAIARFHAAMSALQEKSVQHVLAMRAVLTPAQTKIFDRTVEKALGAAAP
jgi:Spy/CpxP family protein refolding chaperone